MPLDLKQFLAGEEYFIHDTGVKLQWVDEKIVNLRGNLTSDAASLSVDKLIPVDVFPNKSIEGLRTTRKTLRDSERKQVLSTIGKEWFNTSYTGQDLERDAKALQEKRIFQGDLQISPVLIPVDATYRGQYKRMFTVIPDRLVVEYDSMKPQRVKSMRTYIQRTLGWRLDEFLSRWNPTYDVFQIKVSGLVPLPELVKAREGLLGVEGIKAVRYENMPLEMPLADFQSLDAGSINQWYLPFHQFPTQAPPHKARVAIVDTGCAQDHEALEDAWIPASEFTAGEQNLLDTYEAAPNTSDPMHGHGTAVGGIIAMRRNGDYTGAFPDAKLFSVNQMINYSDVGISATINALAEGMDVINMSLEGYHINENSGGFNPENIADAFQNAHNQGTIVVVAAGNGGDLGQGLSVFAQMPEVMTVGAARMQGTALQWHPDSSYGGMQDAVGVSVVAAGEAIFTTDVPLQDGFIPDPINAIGGDEAYRGYNNQFSHTSAATPFVSALAALMMAHYPPENRTIGVVHKIKRFIESTAMDIPGYDFSTVNQANFSSKGWHPRLGYGMIHAQAAIDKLKADLATSTPGGEISTGTSIEEEEQETSTSETTGESSTSEGNNGGGSGNCLGITLGLLAVSATAIYHLFVWLT